MQRGKSILYGYLNILPALLFISLFIAWPLLESLRLSLFSWDGLTRPTFVGLDNYFRLFTEDRSFPTAVLNTFIFSTISTFGIIVTGFLLAYALERRMPGWRLYRVTWFLPVVLSQTVVSVLWGKFLDPTMGAVNRALHFLGLGFLGRDWLGDPSIVIYVASFVSIWQYAGYSMILLLAAMEGVSLEIHDAATIDGVSQMRRLASVTFPIIKPVFAVVVMLILIGSLKTFDSIFVLTRGGPGDSSTVLSLLLYKNAFQYSTYGYGSAIATIMLILIFATSMTYQKFLKNEDLY